MEQLAKELPRNMHAEWTELSYLQKLASKVESFRDLQQNAFSALMQAGLILFITGLALYVRSHPVEKTA